jgi:NAD+ synthase
MNIEQKLEKYIEYLVKWLRDLVLSNNLKGVVVGISGGVDSALVCALACKAIGSDKVLGVYIDIESSELDNECANLVKLDTNCKYISLNLTKEFHSLKNIISTLGDKHVAANFKARMRMSTLYSYAQSNNYLVLGTDNADEYYTGYFTKYGDGGVDALPIVNLTKKQVRDCSRYLGINEKVYNRKPTASLWENQTDEGEMGFSYDDLDSYLLNKKVDESIVSKIERLHRISSHKRNPLPRPKPFSKLRK